MDTLIPKPVSTAADGGSFSLAETARIVVPPGDAEVAAAGEYLAGRLRPSTGYPLPVVAGEPSAGDIALATGSDHSLGEEGYDLAISADGVRLAAHQPAGLLRGIQTIRQLLPPSVESASRQPGPWPMPTGTIHDAPRYAWRGMMLDVARHFFAVEDVERLIDLCAYYKLNRFHLHLSDDQGWRIAINSWPALTGVGARSAVGGGPGGFYTQADYTRIVDYARQRHITVIPEIDMPGHTNAALASYAGLNCDGKAREPYTGTEVGFSSLCIDQDITYRFIDEVLGELAGLTPGPYLHIGGDEARVTPPGDYRRFVERVQPLVEAHGKTMVGWGEIGQAALRPGAIAQHWHVEEASKAIRAAEQSAQVILSPGGRTYLDMKYDEAFPLGLKWAGCVSVRQSYDWDPDSQVEGLPGESILGVESALWSETLTTLADVETMAFPRLAGHAEIGWSPAAGRGWEEYRHRLAAHGPRLSALGVHFYAAPDVPWPQAGHFA
jgi:hexosaminidase